jgi:hypothetical protein
MSLERLNYWFQKEITTKMRDFPIMALCNVLKDKVPYRDEWFRWQVPVEEFPGDKFPDYCNGAIYMLTDQAAIELLIRTRLVNRMRLEDVLFTGVLGEMANLTRFNTPAFSYDIVSLLMGFGRKKRKETKSKLKINKENFQITRECSEEKVPLQMGIYGLGPSYIEYKFTELMTTINCSAH